MTCHNRVASTARCIEALKAQRIAGMRLHLVLADDGSTDGTASTVGDMFPAATILSGDGSWYWCGGMRRAFDAAMQEDYDFYLWLNDDTCLDQDALMRLVDAHSSATLKLGVPVMVVGSLRDPRTNALSYGGWRQFSGKLWSKTWRKIEPSAESWTGCDTINGNCVLIPQAVVKNTGNLDPIFTHSMGDMDYGFRARKNGCQIVVAPGYCGTCTINDNTGLWTDRSLPLFSRWRSLLGPKGMPVQEWGVFAYRYKGPLWILFWLAPYIGFWLEAVLRARKSDR